MTSTIPKAIIISHVIIFGSIAYTGSSQEMECQYLLKQLDTCWERYISLPICENPSDPLVQCAETQRFAAHRLDCSTEIQSNLKMYWTIYETMRESLCSDKDLYEDFKTKSSCWSIVRNCSAVVSFTLNKVAKDECTSHLEDMQICYYKSQTCTDVVHRFGASLAKRTPCSELMKVEFLQIQKNNENNHKYQAFLLLLVLIASRCMM